MAKIRHYDQGDSWVPEATFKVGNVPTDPSQLTVKIKKPDGTITVLGPISGAGSGDSIVRVSTGVYNTVIPLDTAGYWHCRFEGTGTAHGAQDHECVCDPSAFVADAELSETALVGLDEAKDWLQQANISLTNDLELVRVINDISDRFTDESGREFVPVGTQPAVRRFTADARGIRNGVVNIGDLASAPTLVRILGSNWSSVVATVPNTDYILEPEVRRSWESIRRIQFNSRVVNLRAGMLVEVTGSWGFPVVPGSVRQAVLDSIAMIMDRDVEHYTQDLGVDTSQAGGANVIVLGGRPMILSLPPVAIAVARDFNDPLVG